MYLYIDFVNIGDEEDFFHFVSFRCLVGSIRDTLQKTKYFISIYRGLRLRGKLPGQ